MKKNLYVAFTKDIHVNDVDDNETVFAELKAISAEAHKLGFAIEHMNTSTIKGDE